jgi:hypothetical protein
MRNKLSLCQGGTYFSKIWETSQNSRCQTGDTKQIPYWGSTHIRCQRTKASHHGNLAPRICAHFLCAFIWELWFTQQYNHSHHYIFKAFKYPRNRIFLMGCYSNNCALRKKVYYHFSIYSLHRCENSRVYRLHNTSILSVDVKTKKTKVEISVFGGWSWMW